MKASAQCTDLIKRFEDEAGFNAGLCSQLTAYKPVPTDPWTIGWGTTRNVVEGMTITPEQADQLLAEDIARTEADLNVMLRGCKLTQGQWDAIVDLGYNVGARRLPSIAPKFWKALWSGDKQTAVVELADINKAGGVVLEGLTRRRHAEQVLFLS